MVFGEKGTQGFPLKFLDILSREQRNLPSTVTYLSNWYLHF
ncbi:unnamed protein product, partial [Brassica oleracea]